MKDELVLFETAKLAKEKGFDGKVTLHYESNGNRFYNTIPCNFNNVDLICSAPTQSLLQKWLREKHSIFVDCSHSRINDDGIVTLYQTQITSCSVGESYNFKWHPISKDCYGLTYEEALEKGLQEALKLI